VICMWQKGGRKRHTGVQDLLVGGDMNTIHGGKRGTKNKNNTKEMRNERGEKSQRNLYI